ncbi:MAG: hypothetical protein BMS9Abin37_2743 [Acidobacteriota bacterium]|nr:MAG: hypothetical protein BMS9Abin37_2743 [Acidobacteriota bacterium]
MPIVAFHREIVGVTERGMRYLHAYPRCSGRAVP